MEKKARKEQKKGKKKGKGRNFVQFGFFL